MGKINSRAKGKSAEREVIGLLQEMIPTLKLERNLDQTRDGGYDIKGLEGWGPEVKRYAQITWGDVDNFWKQTTTQAKDTGRKPVLFMREDRAPWVVVVRLTDIMDDIVPEVMTLESMAAWGLELTCQLTMAGFVHVWKYNHWEI